MRGPGSEPFAIASRRGTSLGEPTLCTVVKPAISVTQAFVAARYAASWVVSPGPAFFPSLPKLQVMCTCASIQPGIDRKSTRLNSSHVRISYAVFCLKKKKHDISHNVLAG